MHVWQMVPLAFLFPAAASAECDLCAPEIHLTRSMADCFLLGYDEILAEMQKQKQAYHNVDLSACKKAAMTSGGNWNPGFPTHVADAGIIDGGREINPLIDYENQWWREPPIPTDEFMLDRPGLECLRRTITEMPEIFDPAGTFVFSTMCNRQGENAGEPR